MHKAPLQLHRELCNESTHMTKGKMTERCNRRERAGVSKREWEGESRRETHRARDRG